MKRRQLTPTSAPDLAHEQASLIAQLAVCSTFPADVIEYFRRMLAKYSPTEFRAALAQVLTEMAAEGWTTDFPAGDDAHNVLLLDAGLLRLERLAPSTESYRPLLAAA